MPKLINPRYVIDVTQADIDTVRAFPTCERSSSWCCPLARATARAVGRSAEYGEMSVDVDGIYLANRFTDRLRRASGPLPRAARRFIHRWDAGLSVEPIRFTLAIRDV